MKRLLCFAGGMLALLLSGPAQAQTLPPSVSPQDLQRLAQDLTRLPEQDWFHQNNEEFERSLQDFVTQVQQGESSSPVLTIEPPLLPPNPELPSHPAPVRSPRN